jgi:hypothetical protein
MPLVSLLPFLALFVVPSSYVMLPAALLRIPLSLPPVLVVGGRFKTVSS